MRQTPYSRTAVVAIIAVFSMLSPGAAFAATTLSQGYTASTSIPQGSLVSVTNNTANTIEPTNSSNVKDLIGITINSDSSLLTLSDSTQTQVQVATSGIVSALVSDINGPINQGDSITASPITGVGMKATDNAKIIGIAQGTPSKDAMSSYTDSSGKKQPFSLGHVDVLVNVGYFYKQPEKTLIPGAIQNLANALAGKTVATAPIIICMAIFVIMLVIVSSIIYSMIRSSIISVGRNPMSQSAVYRDVIHLSLLIVGILTVSVVSIYLVLTRF